MILLVLLTTETTDAETNEDKDTTFKNNQILYITILRITYISEDEFPVLGSSLSLGEIVDWSSGFSGLPVVSLESLSSLLVSSLTTTESKSKAPVTTMDTGWASVLKLLRVILTRRVVDICTRVRTSSALKEITWTLLSSSGTSNLLSILNILFTH